MKLPFGSGIVFLLVIHNQEITMLAVVVDSDFRTVGVFEMLKFKFANGNGVVVWKVPARHGVESRRADIGI
jgi:hypothetical protein